MDAMASQITSLTIVYSTAYSGTDQRKHQIAAELAHYFVLISILTIQSPDCCIIFHVEMIHSDKIYIMST